MLALCETAGCRRQRMLAYFGETDAAEACGNCDTCLSPPSVWDGTVAAQKLLSTVVRLSRLGGPAFGAGQPIDILLGKKTPRVLSYGHDSLSTFGIGMELSEGEWRGVVRQLLASGLLAVKGDHGTLALTDLSGEGMRGERPVAFRRGPPEPPAPPPAPRGPAGGARGGGGGAGGKGRPGRAGAAGLGGGGDGGGGAGRVRGGPAEAPGPAAVAAGPGGRLWCGCGCRGGTARSPGVVARGRAGVRAAAYVADV